LPRLLHARGRTGHQRPPAGAVVVGDDAVDIPVRFGRDVVDLGVETTCGDKIATHVILGERGDHAVKIFHSRHDLSLILRKRGNETLCESTQAIVDRNRCRRYPCRGRRLDARRRQRLDWSLINDHVERHDREERRNRDDRASQPYQVNPCHVRNFSGSIGKRARAEYTRRAADEER